MTSGPAPSGTPAAPKEAVNIAVAGLLTAAAAFGQWAALTSRYVDQIAPVLGGGRSDPTKPQDPVGTMLDSYVAYLRDVAELPRLSVLRFYNELARLKEEAGRP